MTLIWWNFEVTIFEVTVHFTPEQIENGKDLKESFELSGTSD